MRRGGITPRERDAIIDAFKSGRTLASVALIFPARSPATLGALRAIANRESQGA